MELIENDIIYTAQGKSPSPLQDFHHLIVNKTEIIFRTWEISPRKVRSASLEEKVSHAEFQACWDLKNDIKRVFGDEVLRYISGIALGHYDLLPRLSLKLLKKICLYLNLEDIITLSCVNKLFYQLCSSEELWKDIFFKHYSLPVSEELETLAEKKGWKKLAFTNILKLRTSLVKMSKKLKKQCDPLFSEKFSTVSLKSSLANDEETNMLRQSMFLNDTFNNFEMRDRGDVRVQKESDYSDDDASSKRSRKSEWSNTSTEKKGINRRESIIQEVKSFLQNCEDLNLIEGGYMADADLEKKRLLDVKRSKESEEGFLSEEKESLPVEPRESIILPPVNSRFPQINKSSAQNSIGDRKTRSKQVQFFTRELTKSSSTKDSLMNNRFPNKKSILMDSFVTNPPAEPSPTHIENNNEKWPTRKSNHFLQNMSNDELLMTKAAKNNIILKELKGYGITDDKLKEFMNL